MQQKKSEKVDDFVRISSDTSWKFEFSEIRLAKSDFFVQLQ